MASNDYVFTMVTEQLTNHMRNLGIASTAELQVAFNLQSLEMANLERVRMYMQTQFAAINQELNRRVANEGEGIVEGVPITAPTGKPDVAPPTPAREEIRSVEPRQPSAEERKRIRTGDSGNRRHSAPERRDRGGSVANKMRIREDSRTPERKPFLRSESGEPVSMSGEPVQRATGGTTQTTATSSGQQINPSGVPPPPPPPRATPQASTTQLPVAPRAYTD